MVESMNSSMISLTYRHLVATSCEISLLSNETAMLKNDMIKMQLVLSERQIGVEVD
jgi:hypothetical protein